MSKFIRNFTTALILAASSPFFLGCDDASVHEGRSVHVSADELASLAEGEAYIVNVKDEVTYHIEASEGERDLSKVMLLREDGTGVSLERTFRDAPELAGVDPALLAGATITIQAADATHEEIAFRKSVCGVIIVTPDVIIIIVWACEAQ